jgi:exopolyphosphatase/guanosine-5'-triphosphate,3'-diphosphate pyrophosphatase
MTETQHRSDVVAAIDLGTNSTRLLVHDGTNTCERLMTITRLGQDVDRTGRLASEAIDRVVTCLREYRTVMDRHQVGRVRVVATSAARDATNCDEFFDAVEAVVGARPELLSGQQEGQLSFRGATADLDPTDGPFLVFDIGGGSTEFVYGTERAESTISLDIGCVRMTEKYVEHDPPLPEELLACLSVTEAYLDDVAREIPQASTARTFVGLAGTVSTAAAVEIGMDTYDRDQIHHFGLTRAAAEDVYRTLVTENRQQRIHNPGMEEARADVIVGGICVLIRVMRYFDIDELVVSESDILDGLVFSLHEDTSIGALLA